VGFNGVVNLVVCVALMLDSVVKLWQDGSVRPSVGRSVGH